MITLSLDNLSPQRLGEAHGLSIDSLYTEYANRIQEAVNSLWKLPQEGNSWRGWLHLSQDKTELNAMKAYAQSIEGQFEHLVIIGIGGSALGALAMFEALLPSYWNERSAEQRQRKPKVYFIDNVDPDKLQGLLDILDLQKTLINVITKSGTTAETMAGYLWLKQKLVEQVGAETVKHHLVFTTDPEKGILRPLALEEDITTFSVPADVGGRFSVFSAVGLLPALILGLAVDEMLSGITDLIPTLQETAVEKNIAAQGALIQYAAYLQGKHISVLMPYSAKLAFVSDWYVQLWAESLGKHHDLQGSVINAGPTPLKAVGVTDQHAQVQLFNEGPFDKIITFIRLGKFSSNLTIPNTYPNLPDLSYLGDQRFETLLQAEADATRASLTKNNRLNLTLTLPQLDAYHFAQLLYLLEVQTALMGTLLNVDPFNQPGVELAKIYTYALMGRPGFEHLQEEALGKEAPAAACSI
jgi:glucose-6-phosphate isomerase